MGHEFCGAAKVAPATVSDQMLQSTPSMGQPVGFIRSGKAVGFNHIASGQQGVWAVPGDFSVPERDDAEPYESELLSQEEVESRGFAWNGDSSDLSSHDDLPETSEFPAEFLLVHQGRRELLHTVRQPAYSSLRVVLSPGEHVRLVRLNHDRPWCQGTHGQCSAAVLVAIITSARAVWKLMRTRPCFSGLNDCTVQPGVREQRSQLHRLFRERQSCRGTFL